MAWCADPTCGQLATRELLGVAMCDAYYVEALEHSAHLVVTEHQEVLASELVHDALVALKQQRAADLRRLHDRQRKRKERTGNGG